MSDVQAQVAGLSIYPVKSCGGIALTDAELAPTGLDLDRQWMVTDRHGDMLTQRELPRMALISCQLKHDNLVLRAPGMLALHVRVDTVEEPCRVRVWDDEVRAFTMGALAAQWFSDFLGQPLQLVRFDPDERRLSNPRWTGGIDAENGFADGYPILVANNASLADLNSRLQQRGAAPVQMRRFRPNLVLDGLQPWDEDHLELLTIAGDGGDIVLRLVKPCVRCSIPNVDPDSATTGSEPGTTLAGFRADARMNGGITFGMNAIIVAGFEHRLRVGQAVRAAYAFG